MAQMGDIVVRLNADTTAYAAALSGATDINRRLAQSARVSGAQLDAQLEMMERFGKVRKGYSGLDDVLQGRRMQSRVDYAAAVASTAAFRAEMSDAEIQENRLLVGLEGLKRTSLEMASANETLAATLGTRTAREELLSQAVSRSAQVMLQEQGVLQQTRDAANSATIQQNLLATSIAKEQRAAVEATQANRLHAAQLNNSQIQAARLAQSYQQMVSRSLQARQATMDLSAANGHFQRTTTLSRATLTKYSKDLAMAAQMKQRFTLASARGQMALQQMVFAVDDAAASYGTGGLSGAIRGAANNISMLAMTVGGPVVAGLTVAATAAIQLYMAFNKTKDAAKEKADAVGSLTEKLNENAEALKRQLAFEREIAGMQAKEAATDDANRSLEERKNRLSEIAAELDGVERSLKATGNVPEPKDWNKPGFGNRASGLASSAMSGLSFLGGNEEQAQRWGQMADKAAQAQQQWDQAQRAHEAAQSTAAELQTRRNELMAEQSRLAQEVERVEAQRTIEQQERNRLIEQEVTHEKNKRTIAQMSLDDAKKIAAVRKQQADDLAMRAIRDPENEALQRELAATREQQQVAESRVSELEARRGERLSLIQQAIRNVESRQSDDVRGPSAIERGSREAAEMMRQMQLSAMRPQQQTPEQKMEQIVMELKNLNETNKRQRELQERALARAQDAGVDF